MDRSDRRALLFAVAFLFAILVTSVVGLAIQLPSGTYDLESIGLTAAAGLGSLALGTAVAWTLRRRF